MSPPTAWIDSKFFEDHFSVPERPLVSSTNASSSSSSSPSSSSSDVATPFSCAKNNEKTKSTIRTPIFRVVLTGGPCAGKTTALSEVAERLRQRGIRVYVVPEIATMLITGGATISQTPSRVLAFQTSLLRAQIALEDSFYAIAESTGEPSLLLCDRGVMDGRAYMTRKMWNKSLNELFSDSIKNSNGNNDIYDDEYDDENDDEGKIGRLRDDRYEMICHMVTAAEGAVKYYTLENNRARYEDVEQAIQVDYKLRNAWVGHPHLRIIDNRTSFKEKINRVYKHIASLFGLIDEEDEKNGGKQLKKRKFLIHLKDLSKDMQCHFGLKEFQVEQTFLERGNMTSLNKNNHRDGQDHVLVKESVRKRGCGGFFTFVHQVRRTTLFDKVNADHDVKDSVVELKRQITNREYLSLLSFADPKRRPVRIKRQCFLYKGQYFVLDTPMDIRPRVQLLRTHVERDVDQVQVPDWITIVKEVTGQVEWTMHALSMRVSPLQSP